MDINYPIYDLSFLNLPFGNNCNVSALPSHLLFLSIIANSHLYLKTIKAIKGDSIFEKNKLKLLKLVGYKLIFKILLQDIQVVMKYNDHIFNSMLLQDLCHEIGIKTVYIQHAPASYMSPPLQHDLNVLFSADSREKYKLLDPTKKVFDFVDVRLLVSKKYQNEIEGDEKKVLIAVNVLDDMDQLISLIESLTPDFSVLLRLHPRESRSFNEVRMIPKVEITSGTSIWEDMNKCAVVLCNESAVPIEAIFYNKRYYKSAMLSESTDSYSFVKKGLVTKIFSDASELKQAIQQKEICFDKSKISYFIGDYDNYKSLAKQLKDEIESLVH